MYARLFQVRNSSRSIHLFGKVGKVNLVGRVVAAISGFLASATS